MLKIRRVRKQPDGTKQVINTRGPYLTESSYEDAGACRRVVVELTGHSLLVRQRGRRTAMAVPWERVYLLACQIAAAQAAGVHKPARRQVARGRL